MFGLKWLAGKWTQAVQNTLIENGAQSIVRSLDALIARDFGYLPVRSSDFKTLDIAYYDQTRELLTSAGFTHIGDVESNDFKKKNPSVPVLVRLMTSAEGDITAAIFHFDRPDVKVSLRLLDLQTEFTDKTFLATSKSAAAAAISHPPELRMVYAPDLSPAELLSLHRERIREHASRTGALPVPVKTLREAGEQEKRLAFIKNLYYESLPEDMIRRQLASLAEPGMEAELLKRVTDRVLEIRGKLAGRRGPS